MKKYVYPTIVIATLVLGFFIGNAVSSRAQAQSSRQFFNIRLSKVDQLLQYLDARYVEPINIDSITDNAMTAIIEQLDPHSSYIPAKDLEVVNSELDASFSGIGVQFSILQDTVQVVQVIPSGPSEKAGIMAGDKIVAVDDSTFTGKGINNEKVMHTLRGPKGTEVKLTISRQGSSEPLTFDVTRDDIPVHSVDAEFICSEGIGFIKVNKFSATTYDEFMKALATLKSQKATKYIIDLRENSGGYMDQAIKMANEFLGSGDMIVYAEGKAYPRYEARATGSGRFKKNEIVVLIDNFSASAAEIFAGAMQDNDRAQIIGRRSFGKGLVQQQFPLIDGSAARITVAKYYMPSGRCIQRSYELGKQDQYMEDMYERLSNGELFNSDSISIADTTTYYTKGGRKVYGGGGIIPDVFVPQDTSNYTAWFRQCWNKALIYKYALQYTNQNRDKMSKLTTYQQVEAYLDKQNLTEQFAQYAEQNGVERDAKQIAESKPRLRRTLNAYITRNLLGDEQFYPLFMRDDDMAKRAIEILK